MWCAQLVQVQDTKVLKNIPSANVSPVVNWSVHLAVCIGYAGC